MLRHLAITVLFSTGAYCQEVVLVTDQEACNDCLTLELAVTIGDEVEGYVERGQVRRDSRGRYYVPNASALTNVPVFDVDGTFIERIGRDGEGPGEYRGANHVRITEGDTLYVFDYMLRRVTVLSSSYEVVTTKLVDATPHTFGFDVLPDGRLVFNSVFYSAESAGLPLHLISERGRLVRSFGAVDQAYRADDQIGLARQIAATESGVWSAPLHDYRIELWSLNGDLVKTLDREVDWFESTEFEKGRGVRRDKPPRCQVAEFRIDERGLMWTMVWVPDPEWKESIYVTKDERGGERLLANHDDYHDTVIEVIDPETGRVLVSQRFDPRFTRWADADHVYKYYEEPTPHYKVWRVSHQF